MAAAKSDANSVKTLIGVSSVDSTTPTLVAVDPVTGRMLVDIAGGGIQSINTDATSAQTLTVGTTGTDFAIVDNGTGDHKFNLPDASATARGVVTIGTQTIAGAKTFSTAPILSSLTVSQILALDGSGNVQSLSVATYPSLTELSYVKGVTSALQSQINAKGAGTVTAVSIATANGVSGSSSGGATPSLTITLGAITPSTVNGNTFTTGSSTYTGTAAQTYTFPTTTATIARTDAANTFTGTQTIGALVATTVNGNTITTGSSTYTGTAAQTYTFPTTTATIARTDAAQTFTGTQTIPQIVNTPLAASVTSNAATITRASRINNFTNSSAATIAITLSTSGALDGDLLLVRIYDFSAVAQTIGWTNTENSTVTAPTTSNGSTTLPLTVGFQFNGSTTKWRCLMSA